MDQETLFKTIRNREVVLWAGAGFSKYAGYPMGGGLVRHLFDTLSKAQQQQAREYAPSLDADGYPNMPLPAFASLFVNLFNGRLHELRKEVKAVYSARPKSLKTHQQVATIPFFEHIVTTNYDSLFEQAYGQDKLHIVTNGEQIPYQEPNKPTLYKVHGSLEDLNRLLITEEDYRAFYSKADHLLWGAIQALMASKTLLFVGYGLEDPNVLVLFERILDAVKGNMRGAYLVSPNLSQLRIDWLKRHNVTYIQSTGEQLIADLLQDLKDTAVPALKKGGIELGPTTQFLRNLGLNPTIKTSENGYHISQLTGVQGEVAGQVTLTVREDGRASLTQFQQGLSGLAYHIGPSQLVDFEWRVGGVNLGLEMGSLVFVRSHTIEKTVDIEFTGGLCIRDATLRIYSSPEQVDFLVYTDLHKVQIRVPKKNIHAKGFKYSATVSRRHRYTDSVDSGLLHARILQSLGRGEGIALYEDGERIWSKEETPRGLPFIKQGESLERNMQTLQVVEKGFNIRFRRFKLTGDDIDTAAELSYILQMKTRVSKAFKGYVDAVVEDPSQLPESQDQDVVVHQQLDTTYTLLGWKLRIEYEAAHVLKQARYKRRGKDKTAYRITSATRELHTLYGPEQATSVVEAGKPEPIQRLDKIEMETLHGDESE